MTARETVEEKGRRYLAEGRLTVDVAFAGAVRARCRGTSDTYAITHDRSTGWLCDCPARRWCCHLSAAVLVTAPPVPQPPEAPR